MSFLGQDEQIREYQFRFRYLYIALSIAFLIIFSRLWYLQIFNGERYRRYSESNRIKPLKIASPRGMIFDRNKKLLLDNRPAFDLEITPQYLNAAPDREEIIKSVSSMVNMKPEEISAILKKEKGAAFRPIKIKRDLSREEVAIIEAHKLDLPGVAVEVEIRRTNVYGDLAAHLMGYINEVHNRDLLRLNKTATVPYKIGDSIGKTGLESRWESTLRGLDGEDYIEVDALGRRKHSQSKDIVSGLEKKPAVPGKNLILTIDQDLQLAAKQAFEGKVGAVVALSPKTGEVLAALSQPSFDPTIFSRGISNDMWKKLINDDDHPLRDKTIQDHYSPGSTFKAITAIAGLEEKIIDEHTTFNCSGSLRLGNRTYHCHKKHGHGSVNVIQALEQSCDVFFYRVGQKLGVDTIAKYANMLGMGKKTGINLAYEEPGLVPTEAWKKKRFGVEWIAGETLSCAIGQSFMLATPMQLANAYAAIANGGDLWRPYVVKYIESPDGRILKEFKPEKIGRAEISKSTLDIVKKGLYSVVNSPRGTAYYHRVVGGEVAGKTGTSQVFKLSPDKIYMECTKLEYKYRHHGLFVAFAPIDDPVISVATVAEHACHGSSGASPIAFAVIKTYLEKYYPERFGPNSLKAKGKTALSTTKPAGASGANEEEVFLGDVVDQPRTSTEDLVPQPSDEESQ
jgi:penicillin-binding protein 2